MFITFNQIALVTGHQMIEETESEIEGGDKEWRECESKSVNQSYIEMFRFSGTAIQMTADELTRLEVATDARSESGVGLSLQVTARVRSSVVCGVNHRLSSSRLICFALLLLRLNFF